MEHTLQRAAMAEAEVHEEQRILATNAWHLARFVVEHDHQIILPEGFDAGEFFCWCENYPELSCDEKIKFVNQYTALEQAAKNVTARTLVATRIHGQGFWHAVFFTSVGRYLLFLFSITLTFTFLLAWDFGQTSGVIDKLTPFIAAGLGTCVYLLRVTQEKLKTRTYDPAYLPSHLIRLLLGILAGGSIALFPELYMNAENTMRAAQGTVAFFLGYAVDVYYSVLDNIGGKIKSPSA